MTRDRREIIINGKFLLASLEGMPRMGREVTAALDTLLGEGAGPDLRFRMLVPPGGAAQITLKNIPVEEVGRRGGMFWEQVELPRHLRGHYSLHFTGTAPVVVRRGCVVVHDAQFRSTPKSHGRRSRFLYNAITPLVARRFQTVTSVSHYAADEIRRFNVTKRPDIHVIYNGADHVLARTADEGALARFGLRPGAYMLTNSYAHAHKNLDVVFDAVRSHPELAQRLVLFGSSKAANFEARGVTPPEGVTFLGRVSDEELVALIKGAAMFLFPSFTEGFGLPPLEAMLLGTPTICANGGAMPEVCGDGAWFAPPHDGTAWRDAMQRLWSDPGARAQLSAAGRERASRFTWRAAAQAYLDLIAREIAR